MVELGGGHRNVRRRQTGGAFRPGRLFLCRLTDDVDPYERAGAAIAGISLRAAASRRAHSRLIQDGVLNQTPKPKKTGSCDRFQQKPSQDRGSGRARRKTADAPRRPETGERRARFPVRRKHARRNEPGPVAMGRGRSRTGGRARFSASISCRNGSPAACRRPVFREVSLPQ